MSTDLIMTPKPLSLNKDKMTTDRDKFLDLWQRIGAKGDGLAVFDNLKKLYSESHRKYHNANHIHQCLEQFEYVRHLPNDPEAVEMAIWFHDAIYDPRCRNNEFESALFAFSALKDMELRSDWRAWVYILIRSTKHSSLQPEEKEIDIQVINDIDLLSLGKPWGEFVLDSIHIREEYSRISDADFRVRRCKFFWKLLKRSNIYQTQYFHNKYEIRARENLERWIKEFGAL